MALSAAWRWLAAGLFLGALALGDHWLTEGATVGNERNAVAGAVARTAENNARGVVLLGSSTTADWLPTSFLAAIFDKTRGEVVRAHVNGCHQTCTLAEVRGLLAQGRHFEVAIFGTNQFQMCEYPHSKRVLQHRLLIPTQDLPLLFGLYAQSREPLTYFARFAGGAASEAYADTASLQRSWRRSLFGKKREAAPRSWVRPRPLPKSGGPSLCPYAPADVRYKTAAQRALMDSLTELADVAFVLLLPEATLSDPSPASVAAWQRHRESFRAMASEHERIVLIDLTQDGPRLPANFTDGFHLQPNEHIGQRRRLRAALAAGGHVEPAGPR